MEQTNKSLFTLTVEEVEELKEPIQYFNNKLKKGWLIEGEGCQYLPPYSWDKAMNNLLTRIKQWQESQK